MKKVSIVLPVYNGAENIEEAIKSVLSQTYSNLELIIVNDCSTDNTMQIVDMYAKKDERIKVVENAINQRLPRSLNIGFENATGDYFTWTSDDNMYKEDAIEKMEDYLDKLPSVGMVYCDYTIIDENGIVIRDNCLEDTKRLFYCNTVGACFLYRREVAQMVGQYNPDMFLAEDYDYWLRISKVCKIDHLSYNLYFYRHHSQSLSNTRKKEIRKQTVLMWLSHIDYILSCTPDYKDKEVFFDMMLDFDKDNKKEIYNRIIKIIPRYKLHYMKKRLKLLLKRNEQ